MPEPFILYATFAAICLVVYLGGRIALAAMDDVNELMYGEETMKQLLDYPSKKEEGY